MRTKTLILTLALAASCATEVANVTEDAPGFQAASGEGVVLTVLEEASFESPLGSKMKLKAGSTWKPVGSLPQGAVYRPVGDVLFVRARHNHEAWLVVSDGSLAGLYLPVERRIAPLEQPVPLTTD